MVTDKDQNVDPLAQIIESTIKTINRDLSGFSTMSSRLTTTHKEAIARAVILLQKNPNVTLHIKGHSDDRGIEELQNMLSESRARAIYLEMLSSGVTDWSRLSIDGLGFSQPLDAERNTQARQKNRRGELSIPATEHEYGWIFEPVAEELLNVSALQDQPVNTGREFSFTWLELTEPELSRLWLHSLASHLQQNPEQKVLVANVVNYSRGSRAFMSELEKARSELLKDLLIRLGVAPSQIGVLDEQSVYWKQYADNIPTAVDTEKTWLFITK